MNAPKRPQHPAAATAAALATIVLGTGLAGCTTPTADDTVVTERAAAQAAAAPDSATDTLVEFATAKNNTIAFFGPDLGNNDALEFTNGTSYEIPLSVQLLDGAIPPKHDVTISISRLSGPYALRCRQTASVPLLANVGTVNLRCSGTFGSDGQHGHDQTITLLVRQTSPDGKTRVAADATITLAVTAAENRADTTAPAGEATERTTRLDNGESVTATLASVPAWLTAGRSNVLTWQFTHTDAQNPANVTIAATDGNGQPVGIDCPATRVNPQDTPTVDCRITPKDARDLTFTPTWTFANGQTVTQEPLGTIVTTW